MKGFGLLFLQAEAVERVAGAFEEEAGTRRGGEGRGGEIGVGISSSREGNFKLINLQFGLFNNC